MLSESKIAFPLNPRFSHPGGAFFVLTGDDEIAKHTSAKLALAGNVLYRQNRYLPTEAMHVKNDNNARRIRKADFRSRNKRQERHGSIPQWTHPFDRHCARGGDVADGD
jgi:hypothetical protein